MSGQRMLVIGATGLIGAHLAAAAQASGYHVLGVARRKRGLATEPLDITRRAELEATVARFRPTVIAVCSAYPHVDGCEADPERSYRENVAPMEALAEVSRGSSIPLLFYSTDQVFDGTLAHSVESDATHPLNVYARDKAKVEDLLLSRTVNPLIIRTAWVFGPEGDRKNFLYRVLSASQARAELLLPAGQSGCPTSSRWLAESTIGLLTTGLTGIVHATGPELLSKAQWAKRIQHALGLEPLRIREVDWSLAGQVAPRPARVCLRSERHQLTHPPLDVVLETTKPHLFDPS